MTTDVLRDWTEFRALRSEWDALLRVSRADSLFLTTEWVHAWADVVGDRVKPLVVLVRDEADRLVGLAPFYKLPYRFGRVVPIRVLRVVGDYPWGGEYPDWILAPESERETAEAIAKTLAGLRADWDCLWFPSTSPRSGAAERLTEACTRAGLWVRRRSNTFGYVELPPDIGAYTSQLSKNKRQQLKAESARVLGGSARIVQCRERDELGRFLVALFDLHAKRRELLGDVGTFRRKPAQVDFYRRLAPVALERGWLRIFALEDGDAIRAVQYGYVYRNTYYQLQEGFDPEYTKGAGNVLRLKAIEALIAEGVRGYDFLGEMTEHKRRWGAKEETGTDVFVGRPGVRTAPLFLRTVWPTGRYLRPALSLASIGTENQSA